MIRSSIKSFSILVFLCLLATNSPKKTATHQIKGTYIVQSVKQEKDYYLIKFKKSQPTKDDKIVVIELNHPNENFFKENNTLDFFADTLNKDDNEVEAMQIVINRGKGRNRIFIPSRRMKDLNLGESFLKMHGTTNDYRIL